jgi:hypothetical protein
MQDTYMMDADSNQLKDLFELRGPNIVDANSFSVSLLAFRVHEDLENWLRGGNDLLLISRTSIGEDQAVRRIHFYEENVSPGEFINNIFAETIHLEEDFSELDRTYMKFELYEIDRDTGNRQAIVDAFSTLAQSIGAIFPAAAPYAFGASVVVQAIEELISIFEKNVPIVNDEVAFYSGENIRFGRAPLQEGTFVQFAHNVDAQDWKLEASGRVVDSGGSDVPHSYLIFQVSKESFLTPKYVENQKVAKLLEQIENDANNGPKETIEFLKDTIQGYADFKKIERYYDLKRKQEDDPGSISEAELERMHNISEISSIRPYLPT